MPRKRIQVSIAAADLAVIDSAAGEVGESRSAYLCRAALARAHRSQALLSATQAEQVETIVQTALQSRGCRKEDQ